ncbi:MAG: response regulator [bacterium]
MVEQTRSVLVVDDDELIRDKLSGELERKYFKIYEATDGQGALEVFEQKDIDIILLDIKLPDMDGMEVLKEVKGKEPGCEVIVITGYGNQDLAINTLRHGAIDYIEKPVDMEQFKASLGRAEEKLSEKQELSYRETILVVDDEEDIVRRLKKALQREGYEVFGAHTGEAGLEIIRNNKVEVIIVDYRLGDMDGLELLRKANDLYEDIEGIIITGYGKEEIAVEALRSGAVDYLTKPLNLDELLISVENAIEKINLKRNRLYRQRELKISSEIKEKMHEELEEKVEERTKELEKTQAELFQTSKLATLGEMSAGLAHEINQPLGGIDLVTSHIRKLIGRDELTHEKLENGLEDIENSIKRMSKVIKHIRTFARQDSLEFKELQINKTIDNSLELLGEQLRLHEIRLEKEFDDNIPRIEGEPYQLEQVWINLISNARHALDEEENGENFSKRIKIITDYFPGKEEVKVTFEDNGIGMAKEVQDRAFDPFYTTKEMGESSGLGLSISYGIIEEHGGEFEINSEEGEGTEVSVILPRKQQKE